MKQLPCGFIQGVAQQLSRGDAALAARLEREAENVLRGLDPTRFDESDCGYIRRAVFRGMVAVARAAR